MFILKNELNKYYFNDALTKKCKPFNPFLGYSTYLIF